MWQYIYNVLQGLQPIAALATAVAVWVAVKVILTMRKTDLAHLDQSFKDAALKIHEMDEKTDRQHGFVMGAIGEVHKRVDEHLRNHSTGIFGG